MSEVELVTIEEWDAPIKQHSLHLKHDSQLFFLDESLEAKIPRVSQDLFEHRMFPDAIKREIYLQLVDGGEITAEPLESTKLNPASQFIIDSEYLSRLQFYQNKVTWLKEKLTCCLKEMELRADGLVERMPKGTPYFVDFDNGNDANDGTTAIKTNGDGPFATLQAFTAIAVAGDTCTVRRGMIQAVSADLAFANDGTLLLPITMEADFDNTTWVGPVQDETTASETATLIFGSKTVTFAGDISGDIAAGDWIYETTEDNKLFAYEVGAVSGGSNEIVTLKLPYKGNISGAGKTIKIMPDNPIWNTAAGNYEVKLDSDFFWRFQGMHFRGTDGFGVVEINSSKSPVFLDCICEGNGSSGDFGFYFSDDTTYSYIRKCRVYNCVGLRAFQGMGGIAGEFKELLLDGNSAPFVSAVLFGAGNALFEEVETAGCVDDFDAPSATVPMSLNIRVRNCILSSALTFDNQLFVDPQTGIFAEDYNNVVGDSRQLLGLADTEDDIVIQSDTTDVRGGGGATSIKVTPSANLNLLHENARIKIFEYPIYQVKDVAVTYTVYFKSDLDTDWDADPTNVQLWIEADYWGHATNKFRRTIKSTGVCNNFDADDTVWDSLTVTFTPLITGVVYLKGYYAKAQEAAKSNIFFCDTKIVVS